MKQTYKEQFEDPGMAVSYDKTLYEPGSYGKLLWELEKLQLAEFIADVRKTHSHIDYLDFAAGTGRIISFVEDLVDTATGIEISQAMVDLADSKLKKGRMVCRDITNPDSEVEGKYDLITTFRFILNAEPSLRLAGIKALAARLKDDSSRLIFNNHGNLFSHKLLLWPLHALRRRGKGYLPEGNYLTHGQVVRLADEAGLEIERVIGSGVFSSRIAALFGYERAFRYEKSMTHSRLLRLICVNHMYVAKLKRG